MLVRGCADPTEDPLGTPVSKPSMRIAWSPDSGRGAEFGRSMPNPLFAISLRHGGGGANIAINLTAEYRQ